MPQQFTDNARALLTSGIGAGDLSLTVEAAKADRFPSGNTTNWATPLNFFKVVLIDSAGNREVIKVGTRSLGSAVMGNILRGQDGTVARAFTVGSAVICALVAQDLADINAALALQTQATLQTQAAVQSQTYIAATTAGTLTAYTLTPSPAITGYAAGQSFFVTFHAASGVSPTLSVNGLATPPNLVKENVDGTYSNIAAGDIPINHRSRVTLLSTTQALVERLPVAAGGPAFSAYASSTQSVSSGVFTKVAVNTKIFDTNTNYDAVTNYRFTPTVPGYYQISGGIRGSLAAAGAALITVSIYKNGAEYARGAETNTSASTSTFGATVSELLFFNGTTDYVELYGYVGGASPSFITVSVANTGRFAGVFIRGV